LNDTFGQMRVINVKQNVTQLKVPANTGTNLIKGEEKNSCIAWLSHQHVMVFDFSIFQF